MTEEDGPDRSAFGRVLGRYDRGPDGPLLLGIGGIHGNEPAGVEALRRVLRRLSDERPPARGAFVGLAGNLGALARGRRFVERDLNRTWSLERVRALRSGGGGPRDAETGEQAELLATLEEILSGWRGDVYVLDLHTTSAESVPFVTFSDTLRNRSFAAHFPVPVVLGVEEELEGTLLDFVNHLGHVAVGVEGGSHANPKSVDRLETAVWLGLIGAGVLRPDHVPDGDEMRARVRRAVSDVPTVFEVRYRHAMRHRDDFRMRPGYRNFQPVREGEVVAEDHRGEILAPERGRIFLPLYQQQGEEGFFLVREVSPFWLHLSEWLRRLRLDALAHRLPGISRHPEREGTLVVHPRVAGRLAVKLFHLLGYRRERPERGRLILSRRKESPEG